MTAKEKQKQIIWSSSSHSRDIDFYGSADLHGKHVSSDTGYNRVTAAVYFGRDV